MAQNKDIHRVLQQARQGIEAWYNQSPEARVDGVISFSEKTLRQRKAPLS
ncbi:hypothetical protein [Desulforamulus ruminis]|nr:hypothetical protein [Desulforamulus ruminis]